MILSDLLRAKIFDDTGGIVCIQHREIVSLLVLKDARLGIGVRRESTVPVKVIGV